MLTGFTFSARIKRVCIYHSGWCVYPTRVGQYLYPERGSTSVPSEVYYRTSSEVYHSTLSEVYHPTPSEVYYRTPNGVYYCTLLEICRPQPLRKTDLPSAPRFTRGLLTAKLAANGKSIPSVKFLFYRSP